MVARAETPINFKDLSTRLEIAKLSLASPERLLKHLGITPGAVSPLALVNDVENQVEVVFEEAVWNAALLRCHPLVNTATLLIPKAGMEKFLAATGHQVKLVDLSSAS